MTPGVVRWFDGQQWTSHTAPVPVPTPVPTPVASTPVAQTSVAQTPVAPTPAAQMSAASTGTIWTPQESPEITPVFQAYGAAAAMTAPQPSSAPELSSAPGYTSAGYTAPGYAAPGYAAPGYAAPGYAAPGYTAPGYTATGYAATGYAAPGYTAAGYTAPGYNQNAYHQIDLSDAGRSERRTAIGALAVGLLVLVAAAVSLRFASGNGGVIWTGGFIVGAGLLIRAAAAGRAARESGGPGLGAPAWAGAGVVVVVCGVLVVTSLTTMFQPGLPTDPTVGSCFVDLGQEVELVRCDDEHDLVALELVDTMSACPATTTAYVEDAGRVVCMGPETVATSS